MSSLIFYTNPDRIVVATDTLSASAEDGKSFSYTTKALIVPHLRMIICGTGCLGFATQWFVQINDGAVVRDIDHLNYHTPGALQRLWADFLDDDLRLSSTTTIYHFGYSNAGTVRGYAYRSTNQFASEPLEHGLGIKPPVEIPSDIPPLPAGFRRLMDIQRDLEAKKPLQEQVRIGGEIVVHDLDREGCRVFIYDRFEDYENDLETMFGQFAE